jgi:quercetin dioxygenase-like cupin family protein
MGPPTSREGRRSLTIQCQSAADSTILENGAVRSIQIVWPRNAPKALVTITRVTMEPLATSAGRAHSVNEQIWLVEQGSAQIPMDDGQTDGLRAGDVIRTPARTIHRGINPTNKQFVYLS